MSELREQQGIKQFAPLRNQCELLTESDRGREQIPLGWTETAGCYPRDKCIHQLFKAQVDRTPEAVAVVFEGQSLTYRELDTRAERLAHHLRFLGVTQDALVGLCVERSLEMVVALLAILKAGAAYVPLDPHYPRERLRTMLEDTGLEVLVIQRKLRELFPAYPFVVIEVENRVPDCVPAIRDVSVSPNQLAYVMYTAGTTGHPKGVMIPHLGVVRLVVQPNYVSLTSDDVFLQYAPLAFDASTFEIWGSLLNGARLVLCPPRHLTCSELGRLIKEHGVTTLWLTAALFHQMMEEVPLTLAGVRQLLAGGDVLSPAKVRAYLQLPGHGRFINGYGPTENTTFTTCGVFDRPEQVGESVPIGRPVSGSKVRIVDAGGLEVPVGVSGELHAAGDGLARGYLNSPELTAEKFVGGPVGREDDVRWYRTGDLARWLPNGEIEFVGRMDHQVKIRGYRIELGEIEAVLATHPELSTCAVVALNKCAGNKTLSAFLVTREATRLSIDSLRAWLGRKLPEHMVPTSFVFLPVLPMTPNGKVDRKALEKADGIELVSGPDYVAPRNNIEKKLAEIWQEVFRRDRVGIQDNFFDLGGHSLLAGIIGSQISRRLGVAVLPGLILKYPTIEQLARELASREEHGLEEPPVAKAKRDSPCLMSFAQQRMWLLQQTLPDSATYNEPVAYRMLGRWDRDRVRRVLQVIMDRHEVLRTALLQRGDALIQQVSAANHAVLPWHETILSPTRSDQQEAILEACLVEETRQPFDLAQAPLWRGRWLECGEEHAFLVFTFHHSIVDEWSLRLFSKEFESLYAADGQLLQGELPELSVQYADFSAWQRQRLTGPLLEENQAYWQEQLSNLPPALALPMDRVRPARLSGAGAVHDFWVPGHVANRLREVARQERTTLFTTMLAAFQAWLFRYTGQTDLVVGTPVTSRNRVEIESLIGFFLNTLPIRVRLEGDWTFKKMLRQVGATLSGVFEHSALPFEQIFELATRETEVGNQPLYQVMFVLVEEGLPALEFEGAEAQPISVHTRTSKADLTLSIVAEGEAWACRLEYSTDLFTPERVARMARHLTELLRAVAANSDEAIDQLNLMPDSERLQVLEEWNKTARDYPRDKSIHRLFEEQVERTPNAVAVVFEGQSLTYGELNARANQLGRHLRSLGVGPEVLVGLCVERSLEMIVGLLGILKAGGAYVPIEPTVSRERLALVLEDANPAVLLTQATLMPDSLPTHAAVFRLDVDWPCLAHLCRENPECGGRPADLAYVIFTSGSTGRPKGVMVEHRQLVNYVTGVVESLALQPGLRYAMVSTFAADLGYTVLFPSLVTGGQLHVIAPDKASEPRELAAYFDREAIEVLKIVPSHLKALLQSGLPEQAETCLPRRALVLGGEASDWGLIRQVQELAPACQIFNHYGPTETTVGVLFNRLSQHVGGALPATVPLGRPLPNARVYVVDASLRLKAVGLSGELLIGGAGVTRGYLNRPELTAERFVADPFSSEPGARVYKTGDLARYLPDGKLEFLGRTDHQIKIRGYRIELGEIEAALSRHPDLSACAVLARGDDGGNKILTAYLVSRAHVDPAVRSLRQFLAETLPEYMIPARFVMVGSLPLTPNGKVDRQALEKIDGLEIRSDAEYVGPRSELESRLVEIWQTVLGCERVGIDDHFLDLGGHSLKAAVVVGRIYSQLGIEVPMRWLMEHPTVESLARRMQSGVASAQPPIERMNRNVELPMSFSQQRMWWLHQTLSEPAAYHQPVAFRLVGVVDPERLRRALGRIMERHEVLRTALVHESDQLLQRIVPISQIAVPWQEVALGNPSAREPEAWEDRFRAAMRQPFDLAQAPLWRVLWGKLGDNDHVVGVVFHHCIFDEWSARLFIGEWEYFYASDGALIPGATEPPPLPVQYSDYSAWQRRLLTDAVIEPQRAFWSQHLRDLPPPIDLPTDQVRPLQLSGQGAVESFTVKGAVTRQLRALARTEETTLFSVLLTAFHVLLHRVTGGRDIVVGTPLADRARPEIQALMGFFLNTLPIRMRWEGHPTFRQALRTMCALLTEAFRHGDLPFEQIVELAVKRREPGRQPLCQVMFVLLEEEERVARFGPVESRALFLHTGTSKNELTLTILASDDGWACRLEYSTDLLSKTEAALWAGHFAELVRSIGEHPDALVEQLNLLTESERRRLLEEWNQTERDYPRDSDLVELFERQATRTPDALAITEGETSLTYEALNRAASRLSSVLRARGVGRGDCVAILLERSVPFVIAVLGILKAGGAYVPLEREIPPARLQAMLRTASPRLILGRGGPPIEPVSENQLPWVDWNELEQALAQSPVGEPGEVELSEELAYVMYTSGSTGEPKGVAVPHRAVVRLVFAQNYLPFNDEQTYLLLAPTAFDASTLELWAPLLHGSRLIIYPEGPIELAHLAAAIQRHQVTCLWLTSSLFNAIMDTSPELLRPVRNLVVGGEALSVSHIRRALVELPHTRLVNGYGPTEATTFTTTYCISDSLPVAQRSVPIGRPLSNTRVYLLDQNRQPVGTGMTAELYVGGDGLAQGYLNQPELTAARFLPDPFAEIANARMYKTGDLARWRSDGSLEYIGRTDEQVKLRGHRVELGEIQTTLEQHPAVQQAAVIVRSDMAREHVMIAYLVMSDEEVASDDLRDFLSRRLPAYMIPALFVILDQLPVTSNGKIDRAALPAPGVIETMTSKNEESPRGEHELRLMEVWKTLLPNRSIGRRSNFFELGGHSLLAIRLQSCIEQKFGLRFPLAAFFEAPTVESFARQLARTCADSGNSNPIQRVDRSQPLPMSHGQRRMWLLHQMIPDPAAYNVPVAFVIRGQIDAERVRRSLNSLLSRHEILRTALEQQNDAFVARIVPFSEVALPWCEIDLQTVLSGDNPRTVEECLLDEARRPFDLAQAPLWRSTWMTIESEEHVLLFVLHHSVVDEWSLRFFFDELRALYAADGQLELAALPALPIQYVDFAAWQRDRLTGDLLARQRSYWSERLKELPTPLELPLDFPRPPRLSGQGGVYTFELPTSLGLQLRQLAAAQGVTSFCLMLAAFQVWLHRYTGQTDLIVGTPVANRDRPEIQQLIGFFLNTLPIRARLNGEPSFRRVVQDVHEHLLEALAHADLPFEQIVEIAVKGRESARQPLYQVMFVLVEEAPSTVHLGEIAGEPIAIHTRTSKTELTLSVQATGDAWKCRWEYSRDLFDAKSVVRMAEHFTELLRSVVIEPEQLIGRLNLMSVGERQLILEKWNQTDREYALDKTIHQLVEEQVERAPKAVAIVMGQDSLKYEELDGLANKLAWRLRDCGVGPDVMVGLCLERSIEMVIAMLGILKAGGAYVPLDPELPDERLGWIISEIRTPVVLVQKGFKARIDRTVGAMIEGGQILVLENVRLVTGAAPESGPPSSARPNNLAYMMYTSGSTGRPKGVMIEHRSVVNHLLWRQESFPLTSADRFLQKANFSFDIAVWEIFAPLIAGARLILAKQHGPRDPAYMVRLLLDYGVTVAHSGPALLEALLSQEDFRKCVDLKRVFCGGEPLDYELKSRFFEDSQATLYSQYGPTEATIDVTCCQADPAERVTPIGWPIANTRVHVVDDALQPVPIGVRGNLVIGGVSLARGYHNDPQLTHERFVRDPWANDPKARLYLTGDIVRRRRDGNIEFLGRSDSQVKVRGYRIELGEVESAIRRHPQVFACVVTVRERGQWDRALTAFWVEKNSAVPADSLRDWLRGELPDYMLPSRFVKIDQIPLTPSGKVDRRALAAIDISGSTAVESTPTAPGPLEVTLKRLWEEVLGRNAVDVHDNFFDIGGHSLLAARLFVKIQETLNVRLPLAMLFEAPTIHGFVYKLKQAGWEPPCKSLVVMKLGADVNAFPLFLVHGVGGNIVGYHTLVRCFGDERTIYGLQSPVFEDPSVCYTRVEDLARFYVREVLSVHRGGPFYVGGLCFGGAVAYEMAQQLTALGHQVGCVLLLDSYPRRTSHGLSIRRRIAASVRAFGRRGKGHWRELSGLRGGLLRKYLSRKLKTLRRKLRSIIWQLGFRYAAGRGSEKRRDVAKVLNDAKEMNFLAGKSYVTRPYSGRIAVFLATCRQQDDIDYLRSTWVGLALGGVDFYETGGDHVTMIEEPHAKSLADAIESCIKANSPSCPTSTQAYRG